jgi:glycosyltransferase involved in cell wall biosynthesis
MIWWCWISGLALVAIWLLPVLEHAKHLHRIAHITDPEWGPPHDFALPSLTIVVPARNEAGEIEAALRSLIALDYPDPDLKIIAVNDRSTDATGDIMNRLAAESASFGRLRLLHVTELPPRWLGKTHAMWIGARQTTSEWILFTDADCVFRPDALRRAVYYAVSKSVDHLALMPTFDMRTWGERMIISFPQVAGGFVLRPWKVSDPEARDSIGIGAFNLVRREAYVAMGSFEALRLEVVDDLKFGEAIKKARLRQDVVFGRELVTLRWIEGAWGVVRILEKNLFAFLKFRVSLALAACLLLIFVNVWPFAGAILAPGWSRLPLIAAVILIAIRYHQSEPVTGAPTIVFLATPISALLTAIAIVGSAYKAIRNGGVTWRGTTYPLEELRKK